MSRDKFGRSSDSSRYAIRGPKGDGYNLTPEGDYDIEGKLLRNVKNPIVGTDATNMDYVLSVIPEEHVDFYGFENKKLCNVADPQHNTDAVNLRTMTSSLKSVKEVLDSKVGNLDEKLTKTALGQQLTSNSLADMKQKNTELNNKVDDIEKKLTKTASDQTRYSNDIDRIKRINTELNNKVGNLDKKLKTTALGQQLNSNSLADMKQKNTELNNKVDDIEKRLTVTASGQIRDSNDIGILRGHIYDLPGFRIRLTNLENTFNEITSSITHPLTGLVNINTRLAAIEGNLNQKSQGSLEKPK